MTRALSVLALACFTIAAAKPAFTLSPFDDGHEHHRKGSAATYVYVQTQNGVDAFSVAANGALTAVPGTPFMTTGDAVGSNGSYLVSLDGLVLRSYPIEANGALGTEASSIGMTGFAGGG